MNGLIHRYISNRIKSERKKAFLSWLSWIFYSLWIWTLALRLIEEMTIVPSIYRILMLGTYIIGILLVGYHGWFSVYRKYREEAALNELEQHCGDEQQLVRTAWQISGKEETEINGLEKEVLNAAEKKLTNLPLVNLNKRRNRTRYFILSAFFAIIFLSSYENRIAFVRLMNPQSQLAYTQISLESVFEFYKKEDVSVFARFRGRMPDNVQFHYKTKDGEWQLFDVDRRGRSAEKHFLKQTESFEVFVTAGDGISTRRQITVIAPPEIESINAILHHPKYTGMKADTLSGGVIRAMEGDSVEVSFKMTQRMKEGFIELADGQKIQLHPKRYELKGIFTVPDTCRGVYSISGKDKRGMYLTKKTFQMEVRPDKLPVVKLLDPAKDIEVTATTEVPFKIYAHDDFGLKQVGITAKVDDKEVELLQKTLTDSVVVEWKDIAHLLLEKYPVTINSNIRVFAWAKDRKPNRRKRAVSLLRGIDIRAYRLTYKLDKDTSKKSVGSKDMPAFYKLEGLIQSMRNINSGVFKCAHEGGAEKEKQKWSEQTAKAKENTGTLRGKLNLPVELNEEMLSAQNEQDLLIDQINSMQWQGTFSHGEQSLAHLLKVRRALAKMLKKKKGGSSCKNSCSALSELALDIDKLVEKEEEVKRLHEIQLTEESVRAAFDALLLQQKCKAEAEELEARLEIHPDGTKLNLERMQEVIDLMTEDVKLLENQQDAQATILQTIETLKQLALQLRGNDKNNLQETLKKAADMAKKTAMVLEKQAKDKTTIGRRDQKESQCNSKSESDKKKHKEGQKKDSKKKGSKSNKAGQKNGKKKGSQKGNSAGNNSGDKAGGNKPGNDNSGTAIASRNAKTIADWLNQMAQNSEDKAMNERLNQLMNEVKLNKMADKLEKGQLNELQLEKLSEAFKKLEQELRREHLNLTMSKLDRLNTMQNATSRLLGAKLSEEEQEQLLQNLMKDINVSGNDELKSMSRQLRNGSGSIKNGVLQSLDSKLNDMIKDLMKDEIRSSKEIRLTNRYQKLVEKYFKALSDDIDLDESTDKK
ncbi:hypothetical protein EMN47_04215 [Prolixibacteraceae bacterium JC049]|nr:hypothetical protein [Prolixibacteraceae bacterium JC049]